MDALRKRRQRLAKPFLFVAAVAVVLEEWWWYFVRRALERAERIAFVARADAWIRRRPRDQAMALFVGPLALVFAVKLVGLALLVRGHVLAAVVLLVADKIAATVVCAWLWRLTHPALLEFAWIRWLRDALALLRARTHAWLEERPFYRRVREALHDMRMRWRTRGRSWLRRWRPALRPRRDDRG